MNSTIGSGTASQATPQGHRHKRAEVGGRTGDQTIASPMPSPLGHEIPKPNISCTADLCCAGTAEPSEPMQCCSVARHGGCNAVCADEHYGPCHSSTEPAQHHWPRDSIQCVKSYSRYHYLLWIFRWYLCTYFPWFQRSTFPSLLQEIITSMIFICELVWRRSRFCHYLI